LNELICRPQWLEQTHADLKRHEGFRPYAYPDPLSPLGKKHGSKFGYKPARNVLASIGANEKEGAPWTVGYGFTGKDVTPDTTITVEDADEKLYDEIVAHVKGLDKLVPDWLQAPLFVQSVLANLIFNMGAGGLGEFKNTLKMINSGNYVGASANLVKSLWYKQVGSRAVELVTRLATGDISDKHKVTTNS
jgi:GH24 family phage-related lysozyme (muramidase)